MNTVSAKRTSRAFYPIILVLLLVILGLVLKVVWERKAMQKQLDEVVNRSDSSEQEMTNLRSQMKGLEGDTVKSGPAPLLPKDLKAVTDRMGKTDTELASIWKKVNAWSPTPRLSNKNETRLSTVEKGLAKHVLRHPTSNGSGTPGDAVTPAQLDRSIEAAKTAMRKEHGSRLGPTSSSGLASLKKELTQKIYDVLPVGTILPFDSRRRTSSGTVLRGSYASLPGGWKYLEDASGFSRSAIGSLLMPTGTNSVVGSSGGSNTIDIPRSNNWANHKLVQTQRGQGPPTFEPGFAAVPALYADWVQSGKSYILFGPESWRGWRDQSIATVKADITPKHIRVRYIIKVR